MMPGPQERITNMQIPYIIADNRDALVLVPVYLQRNACCSSPSPDVHILLDIHVCSVS